MTLADYLESKAEYIFDNYPVEFYGSVKPEKLNSNRKLIISNLKLALRELSKIHDREFLKERGRLKQTLFCGSISIYCGESPDIISYQVNVDFPHWSFVQAMMGNSYKKFEDIFTFRVSAVKMEFKINYENSVSDEFDVRGEFSDTTYSGYIPSNFLFLNPLIAKMNKFNVIKSTDARMLSYYYCNTLRDFEEIATSFGDFTEFYLGDRYSMYVNIPSKCFLVYETPKGGGVGVIKLEVEEYHDILKCIDYIRKKKQLSNESIFLKDALSTYVYLKIKGNR